MTEKKDKIKTKCLSCNKVMDIFPYLKKENRKNYCSRECSATGQRKDITGVRFGSLISLEYQGTSFTKSGFKKKMWKCICDCGKEVVRASQHLKSGHSQSCGCEQLKKVSKPFGESCLNDFYSHYKSAAKKRGWDFLITKDEFINIVTKECNYCGEPPKERTNGRKSINGKVPLNGVDRVNNSIGYITNNIVTCCSKCNFMKMKLGKDEFISHVSKIAEYQLNKKSVFPVSYLRVIS